MTTPLRRLPALWLLLALALLAAPDPARAQKRPPGPGLNPQAPTLAPVLPLGVQRGTTIELTLSGTSLAEPTGVWTSFPAKVTIPTDANNGKDNAKLRVKLEVPADAPLGFHTLRLATRRGMSNARLFCIDDLPQLLKVATNRTLKTAQPLTAPCVVVGKADAEATDYFKLTVKAGQRLSFEVLGRRLGSAFDPEITLLDAATGRELPGGYNNDALGLQTDARLTYTFKQAGDVVAAVRDVAYKGGPDFHYRLRIGDFPCATTPLPLAARRGSKVAVRFAGPAVEGVAPVEVQVPADPTVQAIQVAPRGAGGLHGWPVMLAVSDLEEALEKDPGKDAKPTPVPVPGAVTGRFEVAEKVGHYTLGLKKGKRYVIEAHTLEHLSPTEVYMTLANDKGARLQATPEAGPPRLDFTAPADGDYRLAVEHLHSWGGPEEVYRVTVTPYHPGFALSLTLDRFGVAPGGTAHLPITLTRTGYTGAVEVSVVGPKGLSGQVTIPAGPPKPPNVPSGLLPLSAAADLPPGPLVFHVEGKATIDGQPVVVWASVRGLLSTSLANLPVPPQTMFTRLAVAVTEKPPFTLTAKPDAPFVNPGKPLTVTVTVARSPEFTGEIVLSATGLPPGVALAPAKVLAGQNSAKVQLNLTPAVKPGQALVTFVGQTTHAGRPFSVSAPPVPVVVKK